MENIKAHAMLLCTDAITPVIWSLNNHLQTFTEAKDKNQKEEEKDKNHKKEEKNPGKR